MYRKVLSAALCCALLAAALAGCSGKRAEDPALNYPTPTILQTDAPELSSAPTEAPTAVPTTEAEEPTAEPTTEAPETTGLESTEPVTTEVELTPEEIERNAFYDAFWELDREETEAWLAAHPKLLENGYFGILADESGLGQDGLDLRTTQGHQVLALDAVHGVLIIRAYLNHSRTVLAIAQDPSKLHLCPSKNIGVMGEKITSIAPRNGAILAMTGSGFDDPGGNGNGGRMAGWCMCDGTSYGRPFGWNYYRFQLLENNYAFVVHADGPAARHTTDAMEFVPALIIDGVLQDPGDWTGNQPRAGIGQNGRGEILMCGVEGRYNDSPGCSVALVGKLMKQYGGVNAMNVDGGTTAIVWYRGKVIMRCSNPRTPDGRYLPNAWVYKAE